MSKVFVQVGERLVEAEVDGKKLGRALKLSQRLSKARGLRPGEPVDLNSLSSDPMSPEKEVVLYQALNALKR